jgi:hypothetical protein
VNGAAYSVSVIVRLLLAALVAFGLFAATAPEPRDAVAQLPTVALVDDAGGTADLALVASGPVLIERSTRIDVPLATPHPVLYQHPWFVFRPPRVATFN